MRLGKAVASSDIVDFLILLCMVTIFTATCAVKAEHSPPGSGALQPSVCEHTHWRKFVTRLRFTATAQRTRNRGVVVDRYTKVGDSLCIDTYLFGR